ncbi:hypothetical protein QBC39DRAFT_360153 [Podospora conica]|nr:hypothetical protein QBC39DRAFT_360153 [Schizothecium conicum]
MINIALLGAGIFAREQHLPAIESNPAFSLKAIYSRSQTSASALASHATATTAPDVYYDTPSIPSTEDKSLAALLARADIHAVVIALPILAQPAVIRRAIEAGKHVLSEKPVAGDLEAARELVGWYEGLAAGGRPVWAVAENYRFIPSLGYAKDEVERVGGGLTTYSMWRNGMVRRGDKYFETGWRKVPEYQGGFLLDGGVHFVAALRMLLAGAGHEIRRVAAFSGLLEEHLVPVDTVSAVAVTGGGRSGTIHMSFGTEFKSGFEIEVVTTEGRVVWTPTRVRTVKRGEEEVVKEFEYSTGVKEEAVAFGEAVERGEVEGRQSPREALKDLEILQRLLESGEGGAVVKDVGA